MGENEDSSAVGVKVQADPRKKNKDGYNQRIITWQRPTSRK